MTPDTPKKIMTDTPKAERLFYAVRSKDGKWFRSKGYGGYGDSWVDELKKAKLYANIGGARSQVTFWATKYPKFGVPDLVEFKMVESRVMDETTRVEKSKNRKILKDQKIAEKRAKWQFELAQKELLAAQEKLARLGGNQK